MPLEKDESAVCVKDICPFKQAGIPEGVLRLSYRCAGAEAAFQDWALIRPPEKGALWIVCIHGHGSHGDQLYTRQDIRRLWLPKFRSCGAGILTPNLRDDAWMSPAAASDLHGLINFLRGEFGARQFLFFSGSMGGASNLIYPILYPEDVTATVALGAASDMGSYYHWCRERNSGVLKDIAEAIEKSYGDAPDDSPEIYKRHSVLEHADRLTMPVFISHGSDDAVIPVAQMRLLAEKMAGAENFVYSEIAGGDHDSPLSRIDAFDWAMEQIASKESPFE